MSRKEEIGNAIETNWLLQPKNVDVYKEYLNFISTNRSLYAEVILLALFFGLDLFMMVIPPLSENKLVLNIQYVLFALMTVKYASGVSFILELRYQNSKNEGLILKFLNKRKFFLRGLYIIAISIQGSLMFIARIISGSCIGDFNGNDNSNMICNKLAPLNEIPMASALLLTLIPLAVVTVLREIRLELIATSWFICSSTIVVGTLAMGPNASVSRNFCIASITISFLLIADVIRQNFSKFQLTFNLHSTLRENERLRMQERATEMRHLVGNVAHDLKTPLSSFIVGVELIQQVMQDCTSIVDEISCKTDVTGIRNCFRTVNSCLDDIHNMNSFMLMMINRCLDYTKASKGMKLLPKNETIRLVDALRLPLKCMSTLKSSEMSLKVAPIHPFICSFIITDMQWLQENLLCLLSNAAKYSTSGEILISTILISRQQMEMSSEEKVKPSKLLPSAMNVSKIYIDDNGSDDKSNYSYSKVETYDVSETVLQAEKEDPDYYLRFEVQDNGIGVPIEAKGQLFNPFSQTQRMAGGTGLGLYSLAKRIEALGGSYGVDSRKDGKMGSIFWFTIPYRPDRTIKEAEPTSFDLSENWWLKPQKKAMSPKDSYSHLNKATSLQTTDVSNTDEFETPKKFNILIVEDATAIAKLTSMTLRRQGHSTTIAENGALGLEAFEKQLQGEQSDRYDVILMDLQMPVMDGIEAIKRIRELEKSRLENCTGMKYPRQRIIGLSANSDRETMQETYLAGVDAFMEKPFKLELFNNYMEYKDL